MLLFFQVTDEELFAWYDKEGTEHFMSNLGTSLCNHKNPTWMKDEKVISDMEKVA